MTAAIEDLADTVNPEGLRLLVGDTDVQYAVVFGSYATGTPTESDTSGLESPVAL